MIVVVDYGLGNVGSIQNMLTRSGASVAVSGDPADISRATKLILPGVGSFDAGMSELHDSGLIDVLHHRVVVQRTPLLGICLGMQMLGLRSEEGGVSGLGWLDLESVRFTGDAAEKVPHMAWSPVAAVPGHPLFHGVDERASFYFSHSYYAIPGQGVSVTATTEYGTTFASTVQRDNVLGVQFHPEKSHRTGMAVLRNFAERVT